MRKLLIVILMLVISGYGITQVEAAEQPENEELQAFCQAKEHSLQKLFYNVVGTNKYLMNMIHGDTEDFVPILFAQCKMENLGIMVFSTLAEVVRTEEIGEVSDMTLAMLDQYVDFLEYDLIKAKLFEGMVGDPNAWAKSKEQLVLRTAVVNLEVTYNLLVHMREKLEELK